ncbi:MAG: hypothetical protein F6K58_19575 [Symploca sp. SIO2E9]|nr:hypothetical protein [Symploca sp. SIO2E9]
MSKLPFLFCLGWGYVVFISLWLMLQLLWHDPPWWLGFVTYLAVYLFAPLPLILVVSLWKRYRRLLLGLSIPTIAFSIFYGVLFLPSLSSQAQVGERSIKVMSFNVFSGNKDHKAIIGAIRASRPDIVGLQEINAKLTTTLVQALAKDYPYRAITQPTPGQSAGVGILSRFPIETATAFPLPGHRLGLRAVLRVNHQRLNVVVVDLLHDPTLTTPASQVASVATEYSENKVIEIKQLKEELLHEGLPFLLLCDCNLADTSQAYKQIAKFARDSFRKVGWGFGHTLYLKPIPFPVQRFDYIWYSDGMVATEARVGQDSGGSDHLPVLGQFRLY